jgi:hypothetical protein
VEKSIHTHEAWYETVVDKRYVEDESCDDKQSGVQVFYLRVLYDRGGYQIHGDHQYHNWNDERHLQQT